jgi:hypothetical protein
MRMKKNTVRVIAVVTVILLLAVPVIMILM